MAWNKTMDVNRYIYNETMRFSKLKDIEEVNEFVVNMPREVWEIAKQQTADLTQGVRKSVLRVFIYLYYWAMRFQGSYSRPRELMYKELSMNKDTLAAALDKLVECGLIVRSNYFKNEGYARRYYVPEKFWNYQCQKEFNNA